jgi:ABC-type nitrate/sulfonate/bicarbonate transport system substrate-binding protein
VGAGQRDGDDLVGEAEAAFADGSVAAWSVWYPFVSVALGQGAKVVTTGKDLDPGYSYLHSDTKAVGNPAETAAIGDLIQRLDLAEQWAARPVQCGRPRRPDRAGVAVAEQLP